MYERGRRLIMEEQYTMSNEELRIAIEDTRLARYRTHETDSIYTTLTKHFEYLLRIQAARASCIENKLEAPSVIDDNTIIATYRTPPPPPPKRLLNEDILLPPPPIPPLKICNAFGYETKESKLKTKQWEIDSELWARQHLPSGL
jgi:hypothetical protein